MIRHIFTLLLLCLSCSIFGQTLTKLSAPDTLLYLKVRTSTSKDTIVAMATDIKQSTVYIVYSKDYGKTWSVQKISKFIPINYSILNDTLYMEIDKTADFGKTFSQNRIVPETYATAKNGTLIARGYSSISRSKDGGKTWVTSGFNLGRYTNAAITLASGRILIFGDIDDSNADGESVIYSDDNGETFKPVNKAPVRDFFPVTPIVAEANGVIYVRKDKGLFKSIDGGLNWTDALMDKHFAVKRLLGIDNKLYAVCDAGLASSLRGFMRLNTAVTFQLAFDAALPYNIDVSFQDAVMGKNNDVFAVCDDSPTWSSSGHFRGIYKISFAPQTSAIEDIDKAARLYPNPVLTQALHLDFSKEIEVIKANIIGIDGKIFKNLSNKGSLKSLQVDVADLNKGIYMLNVTDASGRMQSWRFVKE
jgi:hypothetical protein